jgi:hypothetical protein
MKLFPIRMLVGHTYYFFDVVSHRIPINLVVLSEHDLERKWSFRQEQCATFFGHDLGTNLKIC